MPRRLVVGADTPSSAVLVAAVPIRSLAISVPQIFVCVAAEPNRDAVRIYVPNRSVMSMSTGADGETEAEGETLALGLTDADTDADGETEAEGLTDALTDADGEESGLPCHQRQRSISIAYAGFTSCNASAETRVTVPVHAGVVSSSA